MTEATVRVAVLVDIKIEGKTPDDVIATAGLEAESIVAEAYRYWMHREYRAALEVVGSTVLVAAAELEELFKHPLERVGADLPPETVQADHLPI